MSTEVFWGRIRSAFKGIVSQIAGSGATFLISYISLVKDTTEEYGLFNIVFSIALFGGMVANALWANPLVVAWGGVGAELRVGLVRSFLVRIIGFSIFYGGLVSLFVFAFDGVGFSLGGASAGGVVGAVFLSSAFFSVREYYSRLLYVRKCELGVVLANVSSLFFALVLLAPLFFYGAKSLYGVWLLCSYLFVSSTCFFYFYRKASVSAGDVFSMLPSHEKRREIQKGCGWMLLSSFLYFLRNQGHILMGSFLGGAVLVGLLSASRMFVAPVLIFMPTIGQMLLPRLASGSYSDLKQVRNRCLKLAFVMFLGCLLYFSLVGGVLLLPDFQLIRESEKVHYLHYWFVLTALLCGSAILQFGMQSQKVLGGLAYFNGLATLVGLATFLGTFFIDSGARVLVAMCVGEIVLGVLIFRRLSGPR